MTDKIDISPEEGCPRCGQHEAYGCGCTVVEQLEARNKALSARLTKVEAELHLLKTSGIVEVAVRNPSVMQYMQHWEGRAEAAEAKLAATPSHDALIRAALEAAANFTHTHEVGIKPSSGYVVSPSWIDGTQGTHAGMAYAKAIRALADDPEAIARIIKAAEGRG